MYEKGYGVKHREQGGDVTPATVFRFGSTLKMMTAAALLQQVERGRVELQAPVTRYIPEFQVSGPWPSQHHQRVEPAHAHDVVPGPLRPVHVSLRSCRDRRRRRLFRTGRRVSRAIPLYAPPGSFWNYSNPNFSLAGLIAERAGGLPYHQYMKDRVFGPAGMTSATLLPSDVLAYGDYSYEHYVDLFTGNR